MTTQVAGQLRLILFASIAWCGAAGVTAAQPTLADVKARVPAGNVVVVTDTAGTTIKGTLAIVAQDTVQLRVGGEVRKVVAADIQRIQWQQPDSPLTGVWIGAAIGAIPGIYWLVVDPNECAGLCAEDYAAIAIGAAIGGWIDHLIKRKITVYERGASSAGGRSLMIRPMLTRRTTGVQLSLRF